MNIQKTGLFSCLIAFVLLVPGTVPAHPHVFIKNSMTAVLDKDGLAGIEIRWVFDEMFSAGIIMDHDMNRNRSFENEEILTLKKGYFDALKEHSFFTRITIDARPFEVEYIKDFNAAIKDGSVVYRFFIPCHVKASSAPKQIKVSVYDNSYYTSIQTDKDDVKALNPCGHHIEISLDKDRDISYYFDQFHPDCMMLRLRSR